MKFSAIMFTTTVSFIDRLHSISYFKLHLLFLTENQQHISLKHSHIDKGSCARNYWKPSAEILSSWYQFSQSCSDIMVICYILKLWSVQTLGHCTVRFTITECRFWVAPKEKKSTKYCSTCHKVSSYNAYGKVFVFHLRVVLLEYILCSI